MAFWNEACHALSNKLWIPDDNLEPLFDSNKKSDFKSSHPYIDFDFYGNNSIAQPNLIFTDIPNDDNSDEKLKMATRLETKEFKRFDKNLNKANKVTDDKKLEKHINLMDKIDLKVGTLDGFVRSYRVRILPSAIQKKPIHQFFYDSICVYNKLVSHFTQVYADCDEVATEICKTINDTSQKSYNLAFLLKHNESFPLDFRKMRALKIKEYCEDYYLTPYCIIADVIKEFIANVKGNITKLFKKQITEFSFKHRKHNRKCHSITIESMYTTSDGFYPSILGKMATNDPTFDWKSIMHDYKLIYDKYKKHYYIQIPKYIFQKKIDYERNPFAAMDPGMRKFQTLYGLNHIIMFGETTHMLIIRKLKKIDKLKRKLNQKGKKYNKKLNKKTRRRKWKYKRAIQRIHDSLDGIQRELHYKIANYLCQHYDRIMVTDFSTKKVNSKAGDLEPMTKRVLGKLSHYHFRQRLQDKCQEYGCQYIEVNEAYTTKTCCRCGNLHKTLGSSEVYKCIKCYNIIDRDANASICIFLKNQALVLEN